MLKTSQFVCSALALTAVTLAHAQGAAPQKIGIIHVQAAILSTKEGKKAGDELNAKFGQRKAELEKKQGKLPLSPSQGCCRHSVLVCRVAHGIRHHHCWDVRPG